jgi:hypothetical protein
LEVSDHIECASFMHHSMVISGYRYYTQTIFLLSSPLIFLL